MALSPVSIYLVLKIDAYEKSLVWVRVRVRVRVRV
jgi:hypothetical protein